jgi:hypothetical protein
MGLYLCLSKTAQLVCVELVPPPRRITYRCRCLPHKPKSGSRILPIPRLQIVPKFERWIIHEYKSAWIKNKRFVCTVGEFRKTRHPRNVKLNKVLKACFSRAGNSRFSEAWSLWSHEFANVQNSGILIRRRGRVTNMREPGISTVNGPNFGELPIRESDEDSIRDSGTRTGTNLLGSKSHFGNLLKT